MSGRRTYRNPPIEEALVELQFQSAATWNVTVPGRVYERLRQDYPGEPKEQRVLQAGIRVDEGASGTASLQVGEGGTRVLLQTADSRRLVGVGRDVLSVHNLRPYGGWEEDFRPRVHAALDAYTEVAEPSAVVRVGVRYINHIRLAVDQVDLAELFSVGFEVPEEVGPSVSSFFVRIETALENEIRLATTFASTGAPPGQVGFLLDLDLHANLTTNPLAPDDALTLVDELRAKERVAFEAMIKEPLREHFDA